MVPAVDVTQRDSVEQSSTVTETGALEAEPRGVGAGASGHTHLPVLAEAVLDVASIGPCRTVFDGTIGLGGHAHLLLSRLPELVRYVGVDRDGQALNEARGRLGIHGARFQGLHGTFVDALEMLGPDFVPDVVLLDLGVSSYQLDAPERGFSFRSDGPLDMRMDGQTGPTARDLIRNLSQVELERLLREKGEVEYAGRIARVIHENRVTLATTTQLAQLVVDVIPGKARHMGHVHPATQTFMALRCAVNQEFEQLERALPAWISRLSVGGRIAVITFHSLEDRIAKQTFARESKDCVCPSVLPACACDHRALIERPAKPVVATPDEVAMNPRSRSARLRFGVRR